MRPKDHVATLRFSITHAVDYSKLLLVCCTQTDYWFLPDFLVIELNLLINRCREIVLAFVYGKCKYLRRVICYVTEMWFVHGVLIIWLGC